MKKIYSRLNRKIFASGKIVEKLWKNCLIMVKTVGHQLKQSFKGVSIDRDDSH